MTAENLIYSLYIIWITSVFALALAQGVDLGVRVNARGRACARAESAQGGADIRVGADAQTGGNADTNTSGNAKGPAGSLRRIAKKAREDAKSLIAASPQ